MKGDVTSLIPCKDSKSFVQSIKLGFHETILENASHCAHYIKSPSNKLLQYKREFEIWGVVGHIEFISLLRTIFEKPFSLD